MDFYMMGVILIPFAIVGGTFALIANRKKKHFHEKEDAVVRQVEMDYGVPAQSLFSESKFFSLTHPITITDVNDNIEYTSTSKAFSFTNETHILDHEGVEVAEIRSEAISLHDAHHIYMRDGRTFDVSSELFHFSKDLIHIDYLGWTLLGDFSNLDYVVRDEQNEVVAVVGQKFMSAKSRYSIDIYNLAYRDEIIAIFVTLQLILAARSAAAAAAA